jgi:hypothetical protein
MHGHREVCPSRYRHAVAREIEEAEEAAINKALGGKVVPQSWLTDALVRQRASIAAEARRRADGYARDAILHKRRSWWMARALRDFADTIERGDREVAERERADIEARARSHGGDGEQGRPDWGEE